MKVQLHEKWDVVLTINDEGEVRYWRVVEDGSFVEYEGYPADARPERFRGGIPVVEGPETHVSVEADRG